MNGEHPLESWEQYQKLVLQKLQEHSHQLEDVAEDLNKIQIEIAMLKVRSGLWGLMAGSLSGGILLLVQLLG